MEWNGAASTLDAKSAKDKKKEAGQLENMCCKMSEDEAAFQLTLGSVSSGLESVFLAAMVYRERKRPYVRPFSGFCFGLWRALFDAKTFFSLGCYRRSCKAGRSSSSSSNIEILN